MTVREYFDKTGHQIKEGMTIQHDDGDIELVYETIDGDLGVNASNENHPTFSEMGRQLYPLTEFDLKEWKIIKL